LDAEGVRGLEFGREHGIGEGLVADGADEAEDGCGADGGEAGVGGGGIGPAVDHGVGDFDAGGEVVEEDAARDAGELVEQRCVVGELGVTAEDAGGELAVDGVGGAEEVGRALAADEEGGGSEDLVGEVGAGEELIERDVVELGGGVAGGT